MERGFTHIYYGDGKGKTTTGMGLCTRAAGYGFRVLIYQFMKDNKTSERKILEQVPGITFVDGLESEKFSFQMNEREKEERRSYYLKQFYEVTNKAREEGYQVLFLDEILYTIGAELFPREVLVQYLREKPVDLEVILTGQSPDAELVEMADYVSEIRKVKHPYDKGISSRYGIEK